MLVEFNPTANDDFTDVMVPETVVRDRTCVPGNIQNGPLHNTIPNPATLAHADNNSMWVPDFSPDHYNKMLYTKTGITQRVRTDLTGPDGKPGIDISGLHDAATCTWRCRRARTRSRARRPRGSPCRTPRPGTAPTRCTGRERRLGRPADPGR